MTPYYADESVTLYHGDAVEVVLSVVQRQAVHTVLTDPPFFMPAQAYAGRSESWQRTWADTSILSAWWELVVEALTPRVRDDGHFMVFCDDSSYAVFYPAIYKRWPNVAALTWDKMQPGMGTAWRMSTEFVIAGRGRRAHWTGGAATSVLRHAPVHASQRLHPVEKPLPLLHALLAPTTKAGGLVLDPFAGGGSTLLAARNLGMRSVGVEAEERYCELIAKRFAQGILTEGPGPRCNCAWNDGNAPARVVGHHANCPAWIPRPGALGSAKTGRRLAAQRTGGIVAGPGYVVGEEGPSCP